MLLKRKAVFTSESEDDLPLASFNVKPSIGNGMNGSLNMSQSHDERNSSEADATPKKATKPDPKSRPVRKRAKVKLAEDKAEETSDDDLPLASPRKPAARATNGRSKVKAKVEEESDDDMDVDESSKRSAKSKGNEKASTWKKKGKTKEENKSPKKKKEEEEEEEVFRWWDVPADIEGDGSVKWRRLEHNGVLFPILYTPLPSDVKMKYNGRSF